MATTRKHTLKVRLTPEERERLLARAKGQPISVWLRTLALDGAPALRRRHRSTQQAVSPATVQLTFAVVMATNNLNRLAAALIEHGQSDGEVEQVINDIRHQLSACLRTTQLTAQTGAQNA